MSEVSEDRKKVLREIIMKLHEGLPPQRVKEQFRHFLEEVSPLEISRVEQALIEEGMPREEIQKLCDVHLAVFKEQLEKQKPNVSTQHPIGILLEEHKMLLQLTETLSAAAYKIQQAADVNEVCESVGEVKRVAEELLGAEKHYLREENALFPVLERHGVTEPPAITWMEHNQLREKKKQIRSIVENCKAFSLKEFKGQIGENVKVLSNLLSSHIFKENNILFPTALHVVADEEWKTIKRDFDEIGCCCFTPAEITVKREAVPVEKPKIEEKAVSEGLLQFETGFLTKEEIEAILDTLPVDITFVDGNDTVKYFNKAEKRIFVRTKAIIGRKVQLCHPQKSVHIVNKILETFKKGEKDVAEFWIQTGGRLIHIRYFAVRDKKGTYLGTLEVSQDLTDLKKIEGEKRLLDWKG